MPITATLRTSGTDSSDQFFGGIAHGYYQTAAVDLVAGRLYLLAFMARSRFGTGTLGPDPVQTGANWDLVEWVRFDTPIGNENASLFIWRCQPAANVASAVIQIPTPGVFDGFALWNHGQWHVVEFAGAVDESASNGAGLIVQHPVLETNGVPATSISLAFAAFLSSQTATFAAVGTSDTSGAITPAAGYTELDDTTVGTDRMETAFAATATTPCGGSWANSKDAGVIGVEIGPAAGEGWIVGRVQSGTPVSSGWQ